MLISSNGINKLPKNCLRLANRFLQEDPSFKDILEDHIEDNDEDGCSYHDNTDNAIKCLGACLIS